MVRWLISLTEISAKRAPFRLITPLYEKLTASLAKNLTFATPGPSSRYHPPRFCFSTRGRVVLSKLYAYQEKMM